jgi:hypothetical protein
MKTCDFNPLTDDQNGRVESIRKAGNALVEAIIENTKVSREQSIALTNIEQGVMWAIKGLSRNG